MKHLSLLAVLVLMDLSGSAEAGQYTFYAGYSHGAVVVRSGSYGSFCGTVVSGCALLSCCIVTTCTPLQIKLRAFNSLCVFLCFLRRGWLQRMFLQCCQCRRWCCRG